MAGRGNGGRTIGSLIAFAGALAAAATGPSAAVGLGAVTQQSELGQPLRVVIPLIADGGEDLATECFKLAPSEVDVDGVPQVHFGRVSLERRPSGAQLVVAHSRPVNDPVLRLTVQAGCDAGVRREYLLLMDPPVIDVPQVAEAGPRVDAEIPSAPARAAAARTTDAPATVGAGREPAKASPAGPRPGPRPRINRSPAGGAEQPRLRLSAGAPAPLADAGGESAGQARQVPSQQEQADAIEAETVVLRQRIAELSATVERLQQELKSVDAAERAAEQAPKAPPPAPPPPPDAWWEINWPLLVLVAGLPILIAAGLLWKRRQEAVGRAADWQATGVTQSRRNASTVAPRESRKRDAAASPRAAVPPSSAKPLAVSELLHVTEEARVYVALGRPDRAIDVLSEHLKLSPRSIPAAWLMLLDLYHANDRRQDFRRLAEEFHAQCNVQTPLWEGFTPSAAADVGLEAFPHIAREIVGLWRKPECGTYLERLLYDNREGRRTGFPLGAYSDILTLLQISDAIPAIDIDSDLAQEGKLGPASASPAVKSAGEASATRPTAAQPAPAVAPAQKPLTFELDLDGAARNPPRKPLR